jgi:hypothetical protein
MSPPTQDLLYNLLPSLYRQLDQRQGQPLRALMAVLESEFHLLEEDMAAMYDNWFIETCDLWVVPYIADLLGVRNLQDLHHIPRQRRLVANSIAYRRRKGTLAVLEQVIRDATGWYARCFEYATLVASTQHIAHLRPDAGRTVDVRQLSGETDGQPDAPARTLQVGSDERGRYNCNCIGLDVYRLRSFPVRRSFALPIPGHPGCFTFDPFGREMPLFNHPQPVEHISQRTRPANLPFSIRRNDLAADLHEYRLLYGHLLKQDQPAESSYYGQDRSLYIELPGGNPAVKPANVISMDLRQWPAVQSLSNRMVVVVDVELGRLAFLNLDDLPELSGGGSKDEAINTINMKNLVKDWAERVIVSYNYSFSAEVGGGAYLRKIQLPFPEKALLEIIVAKGTSMPTANSLLTQPLCVPTLREALDLWAEQGHTCAVIRILDNGVYENQLEIKLPPGKCLSIVANSGVRPILGASEEPLLLSLVEAANSAGSAQAERQLYLNGLFLNGGLQIGSTGQKIAPGRLVLKIEHCTLARYKGGKLTLAPLLAKRAVPGLDLTIEHSLLGPLFIPAAKEAGVEKLSVQGSIVDNGAGYAIAANRTGRSPSPALDLKRVTIFGKVHARKVVASDVIFTGPLNAPAPETKYQIRHCFVPPESTTPDREAHPSISTGIAHPHFTSTAYGDPAYAQLSPDCPSQILKGAADGSEMGVFHDLYQAQAGENLRLVLAEYLPLGLHASIRYLT